MTWIDRRALFKSGAAAALLTATGVSAAPRAGGTLRVALRSGRNCALADATIYETLTEIAADGTLHGDIARTWQSDENARHWTFSLRETVFQDGKALTEDDLAATFHRLGHVRLLRDTLHLTLNVPDPNLPYHLARPAFLIKPADRTRSAGSGLYRLRKLEPGRQVIAERVKQHWKGESKGWLDRVELAYFSDAAVRAQALREGLVDAAELGSLDRSMDPSAFTMLPDGSSPTQVVSGKVGLPSKVGQAYPFDNLRMAERWWMV